MYRHTNIYINHKHRIDLSQCLKISIMVSLSPSRRISSLACVIELLFGLGPGSNAFSMLPIAPISTRGGNAVSRGGGQSNSGVHYPMHKGLYLERGGVVGETHIATESCSCDISDIGSRRGGVGKKVS